MTASCRRIQNQIHQPRRLLPTANFSKRKMSGWVVSTAFRCSLRGQLLRKPLEKPLRRLRRQSSRRGATKGEEMISLRLAVPAVLIAAAVAGCFTYFVASSPEADQQLPPTSPNVKGPDTGTQVNIDHHLTPEKQAEEAFKRASKIILRQLPDVQASARTNELPITGRVPLPKRRPKPPMVTP